MAETSGVITVSTKLERIAKLAREMPQAALTTLAHHIDIDWLREAYRRTRRTEPLALTGRQPTSTRGILMKTSAPCSNAPSRAATWRHRCDACTSRRAMARKRG